MRSTMDKLYTVTIQFGGALMCAIQTNDPNLSVSGAVNGWGDSVIADILIEVTKNTEESEVNNG
ncbi:hypothetical protein [Sphingobacterium anhuiense]|uniref:hypothetical protein n=1 Tax=Sphingobacterium anhuiense TaxID=493780 RepID=UPI003C2FA849